MPNYTNVTPEMLIKAGEILKGLDKAHELNFHSTSLGRVNLYIYVYGFLDDPYEGKHYRWNAETATFDFVKDFKEE